MEASRGSSLRCRGHLGRRGSAGVAERDMRPTICDDGGRSARTGTGWIGFVAVDTAASSLESQSDYHAELEHSRELEERDELEQSVEEISGLRRGSRERRAPKVLTDFVRF
ncbi:hypothetical protein V6N11_024111 [Hibiscus sabdariffa]|uniref:Uncharacterized protein n=1 Tax=Hibiscus sabdariffa TaxID=183260 RepID=A0ABR1Z5T0_9ROSI